jgi:hypothetical protein
MISLRARAFWLPKEGNRIEEWEDACAFSEARLQFALSDGASSSFRAHEWAAVLVDEFLNQPPHGTGPAELETWVESCAKRFEAMPVANGEAWYVDEAASRGAFATFLGFGLARTDEPTALNWAAIAIGDTCLFQIRDGRRILAFPLDDPDAFTSTPALLATTERNQSRGAAAALVHRGTAEPGDTFLLATDAFAQWALRAEREDPNVWIMLSRLRNETFLALIAHLRGAHAVENDDVTLLRVTVEATR